MQEYQRQFLSFALAAGALRFGEFPLKSGRVSPYFFNIGRFDSGSALAELGEAYARAIVESGLVFDVLYGPAYKGIPLAAVTAATLYSKFQVDKPYAFNRKEAKDHGEGGTIVGHPLEGRVLIIDDVITAGTAINEAAGVISSQGAVVAGVITALDRQERGRGELSAIQELERAYSISVNSIIQLRHLIQYLESEGSRPDLARLWAYREQYGVEAGDP